ncbi:hypothetical protein Tco_0799566 [Tanacetum coccineum]|uniref:Uncharacterized protein n=1 Tax=Tanacetum coccineum TaxID=301880 RepID=A0ABQ4ZUS8_9ASTR
MGSRRRGVDEGWRTWRASLGLPLFSVGMGSFTGARIRVSADGGGALDIDGYHDSNLFSANSTLGPPALKKIEDMSIEEMRHEQQLVDYEIKDITNDLGYKRFRGEKIDEEYEKGGDDDYIPLGDIVARYSTSKAITPDLPIEEPDKYSKIWGGIKSILNTTSSLEKPCPKSPMSSRTIESLDASPFLSELDSLEEENEDQEEKEFNLEDILQIQDDVPDFEDSRAYGFVHLFELHILSFI